MDSHAKTFKESSFVDRAKFALNGIYSVKTRNNLKKLITERRPDLAIVLRPDYQLSYSVLHELRSNQIPIIQWVVDYKFWCTGGSFFDPHAKAPCYRCAGGNHVHALVRRCAENSIAHSAYGALARYVSHTALSLDQHPDWYITPTESTRDMLVKHVNIDRNKISVVYHPIVAKELQRPSASAVGTHVFWAGQLAWIKGVHTLLKAAKLCKKVQFELYGMDNTGIAPQLFNTIREDGLTDDVHLDTEMRFGDGMKERMMSAFCVVSPSEWADTSEYAVVEAMALGKAVIVGDRGGNAEIVRRANAGIVFPAGDAHALAKAIQRLKEAPQETLEFGKNGQRFVRDYYNDTTFSTSLQRAIHSCLQTTEKTMRSVEKSTPTNVEKSAHTIHS